MLKHDRSASGSSATPPGHTAPTVRETGRWSWPAVTVGILAFAVVTATILIVRGDLAGGRAATSAPSATANPKPTPTSTATARPAVACTLSQLTVSVSDVDRGEGGMGHSSSALLFRNDSDSTCILRGYPDVTGLDASGHAIAQARPTLHGYLGGLDDPAATAPPNVTLAAGRSASALVEALNAAPDGTACTPFAMLRVGVPGDPRSRTVTWGTASGCARMEVHPFVPSNDGQMDPVAPTSGG